MKKIFILLILLVLFLSACTKANLDSGTNSQSTSGESEMNKNNSSLSVSSKQEIAEKYVEILSRASRKKNSDIITKSYTEEHIFEKDFLYQFYNPVNGYNPTMSMLEQHFGFKIECLRKLDEENYYCIYKTKENGFFYCFFSKVGSEFMIYNSCYSKETLTKADFKNLKLGDSIESVTKIDSAFLAIYNFYTKKEYPLPYSLHLLKDGLLIIEYENNNIKKIDFNADFTYSKNVIKYNYKILKDDYPQ
ncbi:MAG: hypothetical protein IJD45_05435 [Clostridia bacterium]|nr:hypothetical protein [Clostridia bacterium]